MRIKTGEDTIGTGGRINNAAKFLRTLKDEGNDLVVVPSTMSGDTKELVSITHKATESNCDQWKIWKESFEATQQKHIYARKETTENLEILSHTKNIVREKLRN